MPPVPRSAPVGGARQNGMLRRSHKKSRNGCVECKQRHIKCDENRPACSNCTITDRSCRYPEKKPSSSGSRAAGTTPNTPSQAPERQGEFQFQLQLQPQSQSQSPAPVNIPDLVPELVANPQAPIPHPTEVGEEPPVNLNHTELLIHFDLNHAVPEMNESLRDKGTRVALDSCADAPYLLHEILAFSARHLAALRPARSNEYLARSVALQNAAIAAFNAGAAQVSAANCVPMILFSSLLGRHLLIDALAVRDPDLTPFLDRYVQSSRIRRGLRAVASASWPLLLQTDLKHFLSWGSRHLEADGEGPECAPLRDLLRRSSSLDPATVDVCIRAADGLQPGFDEIRAWRRSGGREGSSRGQSSVSGAGAGAGGSCGGGVGSDSGGEGDEDEEEDEEMGEGPASGPPQTVSTWSIRCPSEFLGLLEQRQPEAIVVLAYYGAFLHGARSMWQVGDAGAYMVGLIARYLGPQWDEWLAWPRSVIANKEWI